MTGRHFPALNRAVAAMVVLLLVMLAGCGNQPPTSAPRSASGAPSSGPGSAEYTDGTLVVADLNDPETLDPHKATGINVVQMAFLLYDTLVSLDFDLTLRPGLAEKWDISPDGKTYTFSLRRDVKFHSGKSLTAHDVKWTFERWQNPATKSPSVSRIRDVKAIEVKDDHTVVLKLDRPSRVLLNELATGFASILNRESVEKAGADYGLKAADGTGPFKFKEWRQNEAVVLERNPEYRWGPPAYKNRGPAKVKEIHWKTIPEYTTRLLQLESGEVDLILRHVPPFELQRLRRDNKVEIQEFPVLVTRFIGFRVSRPFFRDIAVRKAWNHAINKGAVASSIYHGLAMPADVPLAPGTFGRWDGAPDKTYPYDPNLAKKILDDAGWKVGGDGIREKGGVRLDGIKLLGLPQYRDELSMVQSDLKAIGVGVQIITMDSNALFPALSKGEHDAYFMNVPYNTADVLNTYFHSKSRPSPNRHDWADAETDRLLETWRNETDEKAAVAAIQKLQQLVMEQAIWVPMYYPKSVAALNKSRVRDFRAHPEYDTGSYKALDVWVTKK